MIHTEAISVLKKQMDSLVSQVISLEIQISELLKEKEELSDRAFKLTESIKVLGQDMEKS